MSGSWPIQPCQSLRHSPVASTRMTTPPGGPRRRRECRIDATFDRLAEAMLAELPAPLYTVVDEADVELTDGWRRAGFTIRRREWEYAVPTDPRVTGLEAVLPPSGVTIVDPSKYAVAAAPDRYLGLIRVVTVNRPCIGLVAVRAGEQRHGIARALLAHALGTLHRPGFAAAWTEVHESDQAASALFEGIGARPMSSNLELVRWSAPSAVADPGPRARRFRDRGPMMARTAAVANTQRALAKAQGHPATATSEASPASFLPEATVPAEMVKWTWMSTSERSRIMLSRHPGRRQAVPAAPHRAGVQRRGEL